MHTIIFGKDAEYLRDGLAARPGGHLILKDGTRYTFDVIEIPWNLDAPDRNNNLIEVQRLAYGAGKWMLSTESLFESLEKIQFDAWNKLDEIRSGQQLPRISRRDFQAVVLESPTLCFLQRSPPEMEIVRQINSEFFDQRYARRWGLAQLLQELDNATLQREVRAAAWFEGNVTPLLLRDFSEINADVTKLSAEPVENIPSPPVPENVFRLAGEYWELRFNNSKPVMLRDRLGMRYIHFLIEHRGETYLAVQLGLEVAKTLPESRKLTKEEGLHDDQESSQPMIDEQTRSTVLDTIDYT